MADKTLSQFQISGLGSDTGAVANSDTLIAAFAKINDRLSLSAGGVVTGSTRFGSTALDGGWGFGFTGATATILQVKTSAVQGTEIGLKNTSTGGQDWRFSSTGSTYWSSALPAGQLGFAIGVTPKMAIDTNGVILRAATSAISTSRMFASSVSFSLDESGHNLLVTAKYSDGTTTKTANVALT